MVYAAHTYCGPYWVVNSNSAFARHTWRAHCASANVYAACISNSLAAFDGAHCSCRADLTCGNDPVAQTAGILLHAEHANYVHCVVCRPALQQRFGSGCEAWPRYKPVTAPCDAWNVFQRAAPGGCLSSRKGPCTTFDS